MRKSVGVYLEFRGRQDLYVTHGVMTALTARVPRCNADAPEPASVIAVGFPAVDASAERESGHSLSMRQGTRSRRIAH